MYLYICVFSWVPLFIRYIPDLLSPYTGSSHKKASYQSFEEHASETWTRWPLWGRGKFQLELTRIASQRTKPAIYFRSHVKNNSLNCGQSLVNFSLVTIQTVLLKTCSWLVWLMADLATELERQLTTGKHAEGTKRDFRCPICGSATGQATIVVRFSRAVVNWRSQSVVESCNFNFLNSTVNFL